MATKRPKLLDLFCGAGGAALGYYGAGFDVVGVDINPQPRYPFELIEYDALDQTVWDNLDDYDAIHASPPCQGYSRSMKHLAGPSPRLIGLVRRLCHQSGKLWVIENVPGAPLRCPVELCGVSFGLRVKRHRLFEANFDIVQPPCRCGQEPKRVVNTYDQQGRARLREEFDVSADKVLAEAMGVRWMTKEESREAIPPTYTRHIGLHLRKALKER